MSFIDRNLLDQLAEIPAPDAIVSRASELKVYECDGWTIEKASRTCCCSPHDRAIERDAAALHRNGIPFVPRGAGTGLSGGACRSRP